jgi:hypothetical protein
VNKAQQSQRSLAHRVVKFLIPVFFGSRTGWFLLKIFRPILAVGLRNTTFTCAGKDDGGGAQVQAIVSVAAFAKYFGARFVHTPLSSIEHCPQGVTMEEFCSGWEKVVARFGFTTADTNKFVRYDTQKLLFDFLMLRTKGKSISLENAHFLTDNHPEIYEIVGLAASNRATNTGQNMKIYAHVRRGDVESTGPTSFRFTSDESLRSNIETVRSKFSDESEVFIVTENPDAGFIGRFSDCTIVAERDPIKAILLLASSDVLIIGKSAFSYVAALLSKGPVFYETYWQRPLPSWNILPNVDS